MSTRGSGGGCCADIALSQLILLVGLLQERVVSLPTRVDVQLLLELRVVNIWVLWDFLAPCGLKIKVHILVLEALGQGIVRVCLSEPGMVLLVEHPVFALQLNRRQVLLVRSLLVVECEEECVKVEMLEILPFVEHWNGREKILFPQRYGKLRRVHFLVPRLRQILIWCLEQIHHFSRPLVDLGLWWKVISA